MAELEARATEEVTSARALDACVPMSSAGSDPMHLDVVRRQSPVTPGNWNLRLVVDSAPEPIPLAHTTPRSMAASASTLNITAERKTCYVARGD